MASFFTIILDTTAPSNPTIVIEGGAVYASQQLVTIAIGSDDADKTNYQMKIWGDIDTTYDTNVKATEATSTWITYSSTKQVKLSAGEGQKTIYVRLRDDVYNESGQAQDSITLDTSLPVVTITATAGQKISTMAGKDTASFSFTVSENYVEYKVKVVSASGDAHDTGVQIPVTAGSTNMSGTGSFTGATVVNCTIKGADLQTASSINGNKIIKVFVKDTSGQWSA